MANTKSKRNTLIYGAISLLGIALLAAVGAWWWLRDTVPDMSRPWAPSIHAGVDAPHPPRGPYELEELFLNMDVIARVRLLRVEEVIKSPGENEAYGAYMQFKFEALEYLKGGYGHSPIWANVALEQAEGDTEEEARWKAKYYFERRNALEDDMDAIVFMWDNDLQRRQDHFGLGRFSPESGESYSLGAHGNWLPSMSAIEAAGASDIDEDEFFLEYIRSGASGGSISAATVSMAQLRRLASLSDAALKRRINSLSGFMVVDESLPSETGIDHLSARTRPNWIELIWQTSFNATDVTGYRILRRKQTDSEFIELANIPITEEGYYQDMRDIQPETKYIYRLRAYGASGDIADARIAITTVAALEPLSGAVATPTASPTPSQPTATVVPTATTPAALAPTPTPYPERTLPINLTQTIGGFTVELTAIEDTADGIEVKQSYQTNIPLENYLSVGSPEIRYSNGVTESEFDAYLPAPGEEVDISLGSFIVADTSLTGAVDIPISSVSESGDLSPQPELLVGSKRYAITSLRFETFPGFEGMRVIVYTKPLNRAAKYGMLGIVAFSSAHATLTDGDGGVYDVLFGSTEFAPFNQVVNGQSLTFESMERKRFSSGDILTLSIHGAGNIVGPFVFENVHVVSESAPVETPQVPGGPGAGEATTTPVSAIDPTATPES